MDFNGLKRKQLQQLCKKHGIPANLKNVEMADRLSALFKEEKYGKKRGRSCLKDLSVINGEEVIDSKDTKRVKFSPENEIFVFEKTDPRERRLIARKGRGFRESKDEDDNSDTVKNVEIAEKEKPIIKNLRRRSIVVKPELKSDSKIGDNANGRNLRRKSSVVKPHQMGEEKQMLPTTSKMEELKGEVIEGLKRSSRRNTMINGGFKAKDDEQSHGFEYSNGKIREDVDVEAESSKILANWNSYEEAAVGSISDQTCVATDQVPDSRNGDVGSKPVARNLRRKSAVVKSDQMGEEKCMMPATSKMQKVKGKANDGDNKISESKGLKRRSSRKTVINGSPKTMEVVRRSSRVDRRMSKVEEEVVDDDEDHPSTCHLERAAECVNDQEAIGCSIATPPTVGGKETVTVDFVPPQSLSDCKECIVNEQCHGFEYSISAEKMGGNNEEATEGSSNSAEKMNIMNSTMPLEDCNEETKIIDSTHENIPGAVQPPINDNSMFHNSGDVEAGNTMVADRIVESSLSLNIVADGNLYEETAITPPSIVKRQFCDTVLGSIADQTCVGESLFHSTMKPSLPGSNTTTYVGGQQPSNCLDELKGEMRNTVTLGSSEGIECYDQSRNEQSILPENCCEGSPWLSSSPQMDVTVEDRLTNCDAVIVEESDVQSAVGGEAAGLWVSCDSIFREVEQTAQAFSADQQSSLFISQENIMLGPDKIAEANVQSSIGTEGLTPSSNISAATTNKFIEEGKDITKVTSLRNRGIDSSSNNAEDVHLVQSINKDYSDDRADPSSTTSTFSLYQQSQVNDSIEKGVESCKETPDIAYVESSIQGKSSSAEGNNKIVEQLDEVKVKLEFAKDDMNTFNETEEPQSEKTYSVAKQDAFGLSIEGGTPVLSKERKWCQVKVSPDIFSITDNKTFECVLGSKRDSYLEQCSVVAAEALKSNVSSSKNNSAKFEDRELPVESHSASALSCLDVGSTCIGFSENNLALDTDTDADKQESRLNDNSECADWKSIPEKDINSRLENLSDEYAAQTCSITEEGHEETSNDDLTYFMNDGNMNKVDENDKRVTAMEQENVSCFDEPEFQNLGFGNGKDDNKHSKEPQSKSVAWTTEDFLALGGEIEESVLLQKRKPAADLAYERSTLQYDVLRDETVSEPTKDLECVAVKVDVDDANINRRIHNDSLEKEVDTVAQERRYAQEEGVCILGNESPKSTIHIDFDQAAGQVFTQQKAGSVERATGEGADSAEKDNFKINCEREFGEEVQSKHAMQNSFLIVVSQKGGNDGQNEMVEMCSTLSNEPGHSFEQGKDSDSFGMTSVCGSPRRNSGKSSPTDGASVLNTDAESVVIFCPSPMDQKITCYSATFGIASDCLHTSQDNKSNETVQNACIGYVERVNPGKTIIFKDGQNNEVKPGDMVEPDAEKLQALVCEIDDGPESVVGKNWFESAGKKEMEMQGLTCSSFSAIYWKLDGARGNCEVDTETVEARSNMDSAVIEPSFFSEYEKEFSDIEKASESIPEVQTESHLNAANMTRQENVNEQQEEDAGEKGNDDLASSRLEDLWPFDFDEVSDVNTGILNKKSNNTEADIEFNVHEGNCFFGEPNINQDQMDVNMDSIDKGTRMAEEDHLALEKSNPKHTVQSESRCPDGKDNVTHVGSASNSPICEQNEMIFDPSEEKVRDISVEDMLEPDAEESDVLPSELAMPDNVISQALVHEMDDRPESNAGANLVESADTKELELQVLTISPFSDTETTIARSNIDLGVMEFPLFFGEYENVFSDIEKTSEAIPEVQTDKHLNAAKTTRQENVSEQQEQDAGTIGNDESASSRSEDLLPFDSDEVSDVNCIHANKKSINTEDELDVNVDEGNCFFGEPIINEDHMDVNMHCIDKDASMVEEDHLALEKSKYLEIPPCLNFLFGSAPKHNVHSEGRCPDGKDNVTHVGRAWASNSSICEKNGKIFDPSEEKVRDVSVGDMVEPDAEESDDLPSESTMPDSIKSQALVHEIDDGPESNAGENLVESSGTKEVELQDLTISPFSVVNWMLDSARRNCEIDTDATVSRSNIDSALIEFPLFNGYEKGFSDIEKASEAVPEVQTDNHLNAANTTRQENVSEQQDEDARTNDNDVSASSRSVDLLPFDFDEVSDVNSINANKESINTEAEVEFNVDEGNCFFGEPVINQDHMDVNMDSIDKDTCMAEGDHLASERSENLECSSFANYFMDSAPDYIVHSESRISDGEDNVIHVERASNSPICENNGMISDPSEEKVRGGVVGDIVTISKPEEQDEVAAESFCKPCATTDREGNDSDSVDNKADVESLSPYVSEKVTDKQINPTKSACETALPDAENEVSNSEFVLTDSEIELFWDEATKDELQTAAAEVTISSHKAAVEAEDCAPAPGEQEQVRDNEKQEVGSVVIEVQGCCIDDNSEEKSKELETDEKVEMSSVIQRKNARSVLIHGTPKRQPVVMNGEYTSS